MFCNIDLQEKHIIISLFTTVVSLEYWYIGKWSISSRISVENNSE